MAFVSMSRWRLGEGFDDAALAEAAGTYIGALKDLGAESAKMVRMSPTDGLLFAVYPTAEARDAARPREQEMQKERMSELPVELVEEMAGPVITEG